MIVDAYWDEDRWYFDISIRDAIELPNEAMEALIAKKYGDGKLMGASRGKLVQVKVVKVELIIGYEVTSGATHCHIYPKCLVG